MYRRFFTAVAVTLAVVLSLAAIPAQHASAGPARDIVPDVNLAHLDFLHTTVPYRNVEGHSMTEPGQSLDAWWVYANYISSTGTYSPTGGGAYHPDTNTYDQGAFDTDDVARAAVVYLTHYHFHGDLHSLQMARGALRFVMYMQTTSGPHAGDVVLWMQPDGTLNPASPGDSPSPTDAGPSYWLARSIWALSDGYVLFRTLDPSFAAVLKTRLELALQALDRELIAPNYGHYYLLHGYHTPSWLISDGADASSEAMLGLSTYYRATHDAAAREVLAAFGTGIAAMQFGDARDWPWQALLPWARSVSVWHAWGAHMAMALAVAGRALGRDDWIAAAERDANLFETHLQASFGPVQGLLPAPDDLSQIAYGAETTTDGLLALGQVTGKNVYRQIAGLSAAWFFGNNRAGVQMYQPETGVVYDGINGDGTINRNSGAESTIEGLYALMNVLHDPIARSYLRYSHITAQTTYQKVEAEAGTLSDAASVVTPASAWTGEALWSNNAYVDLAPGGSDTIPVTAPVAGRYRVYIVYDKQIADPGTVGVTVTVDGAVAGRDDEGGAGLQGDALHPDYLWIDSVAVPGELAAGPHTIRLDYAGTGTLHAKIDAVLFQPLVESKVLADDSGATLAFYKSLDERLSLATLPPSGTGRFWRIHVYDHNGTLRFVYIINRDKAGPLAVLPYGYTIATSSM